MKSAMLLSPIPKRSLLGQHLDLMLVVTVHKSGCPDVFPFRLLTMLLSGSPGTFERGGKKAPAGEPFLNGNG